MEQALSFRRRLAVLCVVLLTATPAANGAMPPLERPGGVPSLAPLLQRVTPAVVNISVRSRGPIEENPLLRDPFFRRFFNLPERPQAPPSLSAGSGVIVDARNGYVVTNHHVIENGDEILVTLKDRRRFQAKIVGSDPATDIAVLKIDPDKLTAVPFGDSETLQVGDFVVAIGNPFGLGQTVTSGIVSALGRTGLRLEGYEDFIQTDASINPGNSGGALIALTGELMGINTAIVAPAGGNVGIGFAVPSRMVKVVMGQIVQYGEVRRGRLGVVIQDLTPDLARALGIDQFQGAVVREVEPGSGAAKAGIQAGDVVVAFEGHPLRDSSDLRNRVGLAPVGQTVALTLVRDGKTRVVRVRLERSETPATDVGVDTSVLSGATFRDTKAQDGVLVADIVTNSSAWVHGLRKGDVIVTVNRKPVRSVRAFEAAMKAARNVVALTIRRGKGQVLIVIE